MKPRLYKGHVPDAPCMPLDYRLTAHNGASQQHCQEIITSAMTPLACVSNDASSTVK
jgi:hypothetical protein